MKILRCAVYTRKSTEDGLEQEFNSLDAQREACEAYITSQRHEGWSLVETRYDDGGFSGGNMKRPGLVQLLEHVEQGLVDVIVVYKVDRLTRSLADFAKIVERLDAKEASFVSVTQAFNTTSSMGRLTLNVLLSFAQFEREVTGERIRDKIAASKKKGIWMGGPVPLGYQVIERKLVPVPEEAEQVRTIMRRYIASRSANELIAELEAEGLRTKIQRRTSGPHRGGIPFQRGSLFHLLKNAIYRGKIVHKGEVYEGEHEAIVDEDLWEEVQQRLKAKAPRRKRRKNDPQNAMLQGLLRDREGRPMVATYVTKGSRRYAYYETRKDLATPDDPPATRIARCRLEKHLIEELEALLKDEHALRRLSGCKTAAQLEAVLEKGREFAGDLAATRTCQDTVRNIIASADFGDDRIELQLRGKALGASDDARWEWSIALPRRKAFRETKLRIDVKGGARTPDLQLLQLLADALDARELVLGSPEMSLNALAEQENRCRTHLARLLRLSWLSPKIVRSIVRGTQPSSLKRATLRNCDLPVCWREQERLLGFGA